MPAGIGRPISRGFCPSRAGYSCGLALLIFLFGCRGLQNAVADGDTRTISMHHVHTGETITITYKRNGRYDAAALEKLNWFLRDWRRGKETRMDPQLIDLLWEVQRETGSKEPIDVVCGYRSPGTNAMLRRRSRGVARFSQHMLGHAIDFYIPGVPLEELRVIGLRMQRGGVGFYPTSGSPFVHMDTGGVRMWPRMTRDQLLHVFPDGRTVYLPTDGHPLPGYAVALAELKKRGQNPTETWFEEARAQGLNKNIVLASDQHRSDRSGHDFDMTQADREEDAIEAAEAPAKVPPTPVTQTPSANTFLARLKQEAARRREAAVITAAPSDNSAALYQTASYTVASASEPPAQPTALTPSQIIATRGYWVRLAEDASADRAAQLRAGAARRAELASVADATGSIIPRSGAIEDRVPPGLMLSYAQQTEDVASPKAGTALTKSVPVAQAQAPQPPARTTIAIKRAADQDVSTIVAPRPRAATAQLGARFDDPWLDAIVISPSVSHFLTTSTLGAQDYSALAALVEKPASSVVMKFGADPNPGLTHDHFSGSSVVFISTVTYPTHTASLR